MKKKLVLLAVMLYFSPWLVAQSRVVLIEQFTNSGCPPCAASSPPVFSFTDTTSDVVTVAYHTAFPYSDSMYFENPLESDARVAYYGVAGVPYSIVDGNYYQGATSVFLQSIVSTVNSRQAIQPDYEIDMLSLNLLSNQLEGAFKFTSTSASTSLDSLMAHIVVIEKNVLKNSYAASPGANSETEYGYVMRKMLPDADGTELINKSINGMDTINISWHLEHIKDINEVKIVAFVQNLSTREIYQARWFSPTLIPTGIVKEQKEGVRAVLYPNPAKNKLNIEFSQEQYIHSIQIFDRTGSLVHTYPVNSTISFYTQELNLNDGIYQVKASGNNSHIFKLMVVN